MINRKLIRPNLAELKEKLGPGRQANGIATAAVAVREVGPAPAPPPQQAHAQPQHGPRRKQVPPDSTSAEAFYYVKQMNARTPMVVVLDNGERLRGHIEWYDRNCIKVNRDDAPNMLVFKHAIKYLFKQEEEGRGSELESTQ